MKKTKWNNWAIGFVSIALFAGISVFGGDIARKGASTLVQIVGGDQNHIADVTLDAGIRKLETNASVVVDQLFGRSKNPFSWFSIDTAPNTGDTITLDIAVGEFDPVISVDCTATATENGDRLAMTEFCVDEFNDDVTFAAHWTAIQVEDNTVIYIQSNYVDGRGNRLTSGDFETSVTGAVTTTDAFDTVDRHGVLTALAPDEDDPRLGTFTGTFTTTPEAIGARYFEMFKNGGSSDLQVNGSVTPVEFIIPLDTDEDIFVSQVRCYGGGNGIKFEQFFSKNSALTNGVLMEIKSEDETFSFPALKTSEDFKNVFSFPDTVAFKIDNQAGADQFIAIFRPEVPFVLKEIGTFATDDYIKVTIQDNLTSGLSSFECLAEGFRK